MKENSYKDEFINALEQPNYWRLFVDGYRQVPSEPSPRAPKDENEHKFGPLNWLKREPHSLQRMKDAAKWLVEERLNSELSFELLNEISERSFPIEDHLKTSRDFLLDTSGKVVSFGRIDNENKAQLAEFYENLCTSTGANPQGFSLDYGKIEITWSLSAKKEIYSKMLAQYNTNMKEARSDCEKIQTIVEHCRVIELLHLFADGNGRIELLLLQKELVKHGLSPAIIFNPNLYDHSDIKELVNDVLSGQEAYRHFIQKGFPYDSCIPDTEIKEHIEKLDPEVLKLTRNNFEYSWLYNFTMELKGSLENSELVDFFHGSCFKTYRGVLQSVINKFYPGSQLCTFSRAFPELATVIADGKSRDEMVAHLGGLLKIYNEMKDLDLQSGVIETYFVNDNENFDTQETTTVELSGSD